MSLQDRDYSRGGGYGGAGGSRDAGPADAFRRIGAFLNLSFPVGCYFGISVRVHILFVLLVIFQVWPSAGLTRLGVGAGEQILWNLRWIGLLFGSVLLHEFGHCFGCRAVGGRADNILMWPLGGLAFCDPPRRPWPEFVTVACGPLVNVLLAGGSYAALLAWLGFERMPVSLNPFEMWREQAYWLTAHSTIARLLADLFVVNYALLLFNVLLIFYPFDGGRLVQIALWVRLGYQRSMWIATTLGMFGAVGVAAIGLWQFSQGGSLLLTLIGVFGFITCRQQRQMLRYADMYEPDVDSRFAAAYESADGRRGAWFGSAGVSSTGDGGDRRNDRSPGMFARWKQQRATRQTESRRRQVQSDEAEVNRILDKVRERGLASLTPGEKEMLQRATDRERSR